MSFSVDWEAYNINILIKHQSENIKHNFSCNACIYQIRIQQVLWIKVAGSARCVASRETCESTTKHNQEIKVNKLDKQYYDNYYSDVMYLCAKLGTDSLGVYFPACPLIVCAFPNLFSWLWEATSLVLNGWLFDLLLWPVVHTFITEINTVH